MPGRRTPSLIAVAAALTLGAGLAVSAGLFCTVSALEHDKIGLAFQQRAHVRVTAVRQGLDDALDVLTVSNALFATVGPVTRQQFHEFTAPLLLRYPFIQAFNFHRIVAQAQRSAFEAELARQVPGAVMTEMADGKLVPARVRERHHVVDYLEPMQGNERAFGLDVRPNAHVQMALEQALQSGRPGATKLLQLAQGNSSQLGFLVLMPVYRAGARPITPEQRRTELIGDTAAVFRATDLVQKILASAGLLDNPQLLLSVYASNRADPANLVYRNAPKVSAERAPGRPSWGQPARFQSTFHAAGKAWHVEASPLPRPFLADHLGSMSALLGGILLSFLTAALVQSLTQRSRRVQLLVEQRSADLALSNQRLNADATAHQRTESALLESEQRIQHIAHHDVLTNLPNRAFLQDRLTQAIALANRRKQAFWVLLIDLDRFKFVNDSLGHVAGDLLLKTVAARLVTSLRDSDTVARLSGDGFVVILNEHAEQTLCGEIVRRLMHAIAQPVTFQGTEFSITCSVGITHYAPHCEAAHNLIEQADIAMYCAKKLGRNTFQFYAPAMNDAALERVRIESALHNALARDEFVLHYQAQVDLASGHIVGMEALIRWQHPELGMVAPDRFIALAEETGLIVPIGAWVMRTACAQAQAWQQAGLGRLRLAVNLSARQFGAPDLIASIGAVLAETGLAPACLELELTESLFMTDVMLAVELLHQMKGLGVKLSIDDFGTGYSSFSYLRQFPIDVLKIDRSFIHDIASDANDGAIVVSIIALAHNLKLRVIAEGVETQQQLDFLRSHGCDEMQGYFFSRPLTAAQFEQLLYEGRPLTA